MLSSNEQRLSPVVRGGHGSESESVSALTDRMVLGGSSRVRFVSTAIFSARRRVRALSCDVSRASYLILILQEASVMPLKNECYRLLATDVNHLGPNIVSESEETGGPVSSVYSPRHPTEVRSTRVLHGTRAAFTSLNFFMLL